MKFVLARVDTALCVFRSFDQLDRAEDLYPQAAITPVPDATDVAPATLHRALDRYVKGTDGMAFLRSKYGAAQ